MKLYIQTHNGVNRVFKNAKTLSIDTQKLRVSNAKGEQRFAIKAIKTIELINS